MFKKLGSEEFDSSPKSEPLPSPKPAAPAPLNINTRTIQFQPYRGVGEVHPKNPIGAVIELLRRAPQPDGTWKFIRPFTGIPDKAQYAFSIMQSVPTTTVRRGSHEAPAREPHPAFEAFNACHPEKARTLIGRIIHMKESDAYSFYLGAFQSPSGRGLQNPNDGWWCRGDAKKATRFVNGKYQQIPCPGRLCEFQQDKFGPKGDVPHCKPHLTMIFQLLLAPEWNTPNIIVQFDSQSWNNIAAAEGLFKHVRDTAKPLGYAEGTFPVFGLEFMMNLKERRKGQRKFPEVSISPTGDIMAWMASIHAAYKNLKPHERPELGNAPPSLEALPAPGCTAAQMLQASEAYLNPNYKPANEREKS